MVLNFTSNEWRNMKKGNNLSLYVNQISFVPSTGGRKKENFKVEVDDDKFHPPEQK